MLWPRRKHEPPERETVPASARVCPRPPGHVEVELTASGGRRVSLLLDLINAERFARNLTHACGNVLEHSFMQPTDDGDAS
ncbi:hypothetical protein [Actinobaculum sp. 352]|uniref:hypothetical protein n=1 Tax=Actinobaculum sp. 352 TaxID=2490946 RepID=UPI000F7EADBB|nr:hypothetical protein [Actinobaculum sp. 352]RTE48806.1 hypothetical protein EKN07_08860 [Actinobaculum sp. 352]